MKPETESSVSKAKTNSRTTPGVLTAPVVKKKTAKRGARPKSEPPAITPEKPGTDAASNAPGAAIATSPGSRKFVTDLEFLDTVKETVYRKLLDNELELKIDSGFKAIELKNKISETSENEKLLLEILSEIRTQELGKSKS
jgi:hypothetical protein